MCSLEEILGSFNDLPYLANLLKENSNLILSDLIYSNIVDHFLCQNQITSEGLSVQRNLYGRSRTTILNQNEINLFIFNIKKCLNSTDEQLRKIFLQYLHNINRLLPKNFNDISYLCSIILLSNGNKDVIACILSAYLQINSSNNIRFDLIINRLYENEYENENNQWIDQLTKIIILNDKQWLRKFYLNQIYTDEFLHAIDIHDKENILNIQPIKQDIQQFNSTIIEKIETDIFYDGKYLNEVLTLDDLHSKLIFYIENNLPIERINELSLINLFYFLDIYPDDLHLLFCCLLVRLINPKYNDKINLKLFRYLINLINNYYINQQDLLDDNRYRIIIVYLISKFLCEIHRRRSNNEHEWYYLYREIPKEHPLPTFDLFSDLLRLLSTLTYNNINCQNQVRQISGTIESILSMTQIDLNQPKSQACVTWLIKCLTEFNEENKNYIKQIK